MENLPSVDVTLAPDDSVSVGEDNISGLIVSGVAVVGQFALGAVLGPFLSVADAEAKTITAAYDTTNTCLAHKHISDFFAEAPKGTKLYVMVVAKTVTLAQQVAYNGTYAPALLEAAPDISMIGFTRVPPDAYVYVAEDQFDPDIWAAMTAAKALQADQFGKGRTISTLLVEGRDFAGSASSAKDLSDPGELDAEFVSIVMSQDKAYTTGKAWAAKMAHVGFALGTVASKMVQRNMGRVKDGPRLNIANAALSNGTPITSVSLTDQNTLNAFRYIFLRQLPRKSGFYFNGDHCACPVDSPYNAISKCRPIMKVVRIVHAVYIEELLDDPELDETTGKLNAAVIKFFQSSVEQEVSERMLTGEKQISGFRAIADPDQNIQTTERVKLACTIIPKGMIKGFDITLGYVTSFAN